MLIEKGIDTHNFREKKVLHVWLISAGIIFIAFITVVAPKMLHGTPLSEDIKETYTPDAAYVTPSQVDLEKAKTLFYSLFSSSDFKTDEKTWDLLGFTVERVRSFLIVKEKKSSQTGKGVYIFNTSKPSQVIVEAPHRLSDKYTGTIAIQLIEDGYFLAAALNTVPRKKANLTREEMTYFNAFTEAFGKSYPQGNIIQLHGFDEERHGLFTDLIFSATVSSPPSLFYQYGERLKKLPLNVLLFPDDINILGATKNINAKKLRTTGNRGLFLHLEMDIVLREKLKKNKQFRKHFFGCFFETERPQTPHF